MTLLERHSTSSIIGYREALELKQEMSWRKLNEISVKDAIESFLNSIKSPHTRINYASAFKRLIELDLINLEQSLQQLAIKSGNTLVDKVKQIQGWSEATKQARAAALLSFFRFLSRRTEGLIKRLEPSKEDGSKTFFKIRDEVVTEAMTQSQWIKWLAELKKMNKRDWLIANLALGGGKRIGEVLTLTSDYIDFDKREITFKQSKSKTERKTIITYSQSIMDELKAYLGERNGIVFITNTGRAVLRKQVAYTFARSGERAGVPFLVTPHVLRASAITYLKSQGYNDSQIRQISGHASCEMVAAYDKRSKADNITKQINWVG